MISGNVIAAVRNDEELACAVKSNVSTIFLLRTNIEIINAQLELVHSVGKQLFVHIDLADGIGKDEYGLKYLKNLGVDGIISTRTNIIKTAKKIGLFTVQRFFIVDSHSIETTVESISASKTDVVEIMPGTLTKVVKKLKEQMDTPIVVGGLVDSVQEIQNALDSGAVSVSTGKKGLW
jgi:glycerol uptake operon antiterminator